MKQTINMKNNTFFKLFIIILLGISFRLWFLDKPEGLWFDEYNSWYIATQTNFTEFWRKIITNCHTPLYYLYIKIWSFFFTDSDYSLRLSSVIPSILSITVMYLVGKRYNIGFLCAGFTAISSFNIYFAQEARLYSLIFLFTSLSLLYYIKAKEDPSNKNINLFFTTNALICTTHSLGIIFSILSIIFFYKDNLKKIRENLNYIMPFLVVIFAISPLLFSIATSKTISQFWSEFSITKIICNFIDYYSPIQTNIQNTYNSIFDYIYINNEINTSFIIFAIIPLIIGLICLINSICQRNKMINHLLAIAALYYISLIILTLLGKLILITKYSIELYPILIFTSCFGLSKIKKDFIKKTFVIIFLFLNIFYLYNADDAAPKRTRPEGHKAVVELIENSNLNTNDFIIITYYDKSNFDKYLFQDTYYNIYSLSKYNFSHILFENENYNNMISANNEDYRKFFGEFPNNRIQKYTNLNIISKIEKGERVGLVVLNNVSFIDNSKMQEIIKKNNYKEKTSFMFLMFSTIKNNILYALKQELRLETISKAGDWTLYVYVKD